MGCAKDIVEYVGVPRFLFSDFPLGNPAGRPNDPASQAFTLELALRVLETAPGPRTTVQSPLRWSDNPDWKLDYSNIARLSPEEIARRLGNVSWCTSVRPTCLNPSQHFTCMLCPWHQSEVTDDRSPSVAEVAGLVKSRPNNAKTSLGTRGRCNDPVDTRQAAVSTSAE